MGREGTGVPRRDHRDDGARQIPRPPVRRWVLARTV